MIVVYEMIRCVVAKTINGENHGHGTLSFSFLCAEEVLY